MSELPWKERVTMLSINPDAASREDVANMAAELMETWNHRPPPPQGGQPAEPVEGAPALEKLIEDYKITYRKLRSGFLAGHEYDLIRGARAEAANRRPSTGKEGDVQMPSEPWESKKLTGPEIQQESRGAIPSTTGEDERVAVAEKLLDDCLIYLQSAEKNIQDHSPFAGTPWHDRLKKLIGQLYERKFSLTKDSLAPRPSDVEPPWAKLRPFQTKQGVVRDKHGNMIAEAWGITNGEMICAALNGESK